MNYRRQSGISQFEEDLFSKNVQGIGEIYREVFLLMNFLQTKQQVKSMNINNHDLYYTIFKNRDDKEIVNNEYENKEVDYINLKEFITPNHNISIKPRETILK